jgi:hypothetical protein
LVVVFPAQTPPAGLSSGRVEYTLDGAPQTGYGEYGQWVTIGTAGLPSSTTSFSSLPVSNLSANLPAHGLARESWTLWVRVKSAGDQMFAIQIQAPAHAVAALHVDGQNSTVVNLDNDGAAGRQIAIGQIDLAEGWHTLTLSVVHSSDQPPAAVRAEVFMRGPDEASPVNFTPYALASAPAPTFALGGTARPSARTPATQVAPATTTASAWPHKTVLSALPKTEEKE